MSRRRPAARRWNAHPNRDSPDAGGHRWWDDGRVGWSLLIVDDHADFRAGARALLEVDGFRVLGEAADGEAALEAARRLRPQVVLLDVQLPGMDGFAVADRLALGDDPPMVVLISSRAVESFRHRLRAARSVRGFIAKAELSGECLSELLA
jgi:CheY-like chemotaxis protein